MDDLSARLARNVSALRHQRGLSQVQLAKLAGIPRATWAHVESGAGNPTLAVVSKVAAALQVTIEELISAPRGAARLHKVHTLTTKTRGQVTVRKLLPEPLPHTEIDRLHLTPGARMVGVPHTPGTTEYLSCERGRIALVASGERSILDAGDVVVFRGDQKHSYENVGSVDAVGYSYILISSG